jgi:hypothetical protein
VLEVYEQAIEFSTGMARTHQPPLDTGCGQRTTWQRPGRFSLIYLKRYILKKPSAAQVIFQ